MADINRVQPKGEPNVVPLCDILLVLLIIFMVITPTLQKGIDIHLPEDAPGPHPPDEPIVLTLRCGAGMEINSLSVAPGILTPTLHRIFDGRVSKVLFVRPDRSCAYTEIVRVLDEVRGAGVANICLVPR